MKNPIKMLGMTVILALFVSLISCSSDDDAQVTALKVQGVNSNLMALQLDAEHDLDVLLLPYEAVDKHNYKFSYQSSNGEVATVTEAGKISALKVGETEITITPINNSALETKFTLKVFDENEGQPLDIVSIELDPSILEGITILGSGTFNLLEKLIVNPQVSNNSQLLFTSNNEDVITVNSAGLLVSQKAGTATISISSVKDPEIRTSVEVTVKGLLFDFYDRASWKIHTSHPFIEDGNPAIGGQPEKMVDGDAVSCLLLQKAGVGEVPTLDMVYFVVEIESEKEFDIISHTHRVGLTQLRMQKVNVFGSNNNVNYVLIADDIDLQSPGSNNTVLIDLGKTVKYKYVKVAATQWDSESGMTLQVAEFNIGLKKAE